MYLNTKYNNRCRCTLPNGFGHPPKVKAEFKERQELERTYAATLHRREDMLYHIGGAQQRGEHHQVAVLEKQLLRVDSDLDSLEDRLRELDSRHSGKRPKLKM